MVTLYGTVMGALAMKEPSSLLTAMARSIGGLRSQCCGSARDFFTFSFAVFGGRPRFFGSRLAVLSALRAKLSSGTAPLMRNPTRPGAIFTNAGSLVTHTLIVVFGCLHSDQSRKRKRCDSSTISCNVMPSGPLFFNTANATALVVFPENRISKSCMVSFSDDFPAPPASPTDFFAGLATALPLDFAPPPLFFAGAFNHVNSPSVKSTSVTPSDPFGALSHFTV
mmetsp:Transcript_7069/g.25841  ORF Transcript_7069/g.25841 Transcript_7069/m.25841 type:complete len:224 (+) Transcript_7069:336-1007(+)